MNSKREVGWVVGTFGVFALILCFALSGCASAQVKQSLDSLDSGFEAVVAASDPKPEVSQDRYEALIELYRAHLKELRKEVGP